MTVTPSFHIRLATPDDAEAIGELQWLLWDHHHRLAPARVNSADEIMAVGPEPAGEHDTRDFGLIAQGDGSDAAGVLGYARLILRESPRSRAYRARTTLSVQAISVRPQARRRGIGRALIEQAFAHARENGAEAVQIPVLGFNTQALAFYRALGFQDEFLLIGRAP